MGQQPDPGEAVFLRRGEGRKIAAGGMPVIVKMSPDDDLGYPMIQEQPVPPRMLVPAHRHQRAGQFCFVTEGTLCCLAGDKVYTLQRGDFLFRPPGLVHAVWNPDPVEPALQMEGSLLAAGDMLSFFLAFQELTLSGQLNAERLAETAAPLGTFYDEDLTRRIEEEYSVSASGGWRP
jgi:mannose-6-phosphate isomerase-like protein (cupin superfamily)